MNNKEQFKSWVFNDLTEKSGTGSSYISSLEWLSDKFYKKGRISKKSIFEIEDIDLITELHSEVKKIQRDKSSYIYNKDAPSYGERYFYSASLSKYKEFLLSKNGSSQPQSVKNEVKSKIEEFNFNSFIENVFESGLVFSETLINRFVASLLTKPFVLLTGLSGSGKTKIAQSFVQWICEDESQYKIIPVGADWTNREPLLGYPNGLNANEYILPDSGALNIIIEATKPENQNRPYFLILDEMNLSHVERYFADFLSVMETNDKINLYSGNIRKDLEGNEIPNEIFWSKNLFIIGTVNIDETTYMFSPKVLDRANTIEFRVDETNIKSFFDLPSKVDLSALKRKGSSMAQNFLEISQDNSIDKDDGYTDVFVKFFNELKKVGAEFGYRTAIEMLLLIKKLNTISKFSKNDSIDIAVMQKLLPKLHGSRSKISKVLDALILLCLQEGQMFSIAKSDEVPTENIFYPIAYEKLVRMYKNALDNGFTSYAEA
jgi:5-methylcytosine-specific restriction protein B